jgi:uncharacterized membrane protein
VKRISILFLLLAYFFFSQIATAQESWSINTFDSKINIQPSGQVQITETLNVDFGNLEKHGIYRDMPYAYVREDGSYYYTKIDVQNVTLNNAKVKYEVTRNDANIRVKIGDPDRTISGSQTYEITYLATGILSAFTEHDELYWNVTGNEWEVPIYKTTASVTLPRDSIKRIACYEGPYGSTDPCISSNSLAMANFSSTKTFYPGDGLSIVVGFNKGTVPILTVEKPKSFFEKLFSTSSLAAFALSFIFGTAFVISKWYTKGRDFWLKKLHLNDSRAKHEIKPLGAHETIVVEFDPPEKLRPAQLGTLVDERADTLDVSATIIDFAVRGFLTITEQEKSWTFGKRDYVLKRKNKNTKDLAAYEKLLLEKLFGNNDLVSLSSLKNKFYNDLAKVKQELYKDVVEQKLFPDNPEKIRAKYLIIGVLLDMISIGLAIASANLNQAQMFAFALGLIPAGFLMIVLSRSMPRRTAYGRELLRRVKGYELFLSKAEKYRQQFFERKNLFNEILPYTIVLGLTEKFAKAFSVLGLPEPKPAWYSGTRPFNAMSLADSVSDFSASLSSSIASAPRSQGGFSSGGGFSGGGGGGGGGGSW